MEREPYREELQDLVDGCGEYTVAWGEKPGGANTHCCLSPLTPHWCPALGEASRELEGKLALQYSP